MQALALKQRAAGKEYKQPPQKKARPSAAGSSAVGSSARGRLVAEPAAGGRPEQGTRPEGHVQVCSQALCIGKRLPSQPALCRAQGAWCR